MHDAGSTDLWSAANLLKALPREEGGRRYVFMEASNETEDHDKEIVLAKALQESAQYYLRYGNLDLDHRTQIGPRAGEPSHHLFEIGKPVDVRADGTRTFVKGELYQGDTPVAENANMVWDGLTKCRPAQAWYPSVGGACSKAKVTDPETGQPRTVIHKVRWTNIGMSRTPVNLGVPTMAAVPFGVLAKSTHGGCFDMRKALEAGYGTDVANLSGGGALAKQSLDTHPQSYWELREALAGDIRRNKVTPTVDAMVAHARAHYGLEPAEAAEHVGRFLGDLKRARSSKRAVH